MPSDTLIERLWPNKSGGSATGVASDYDASVNDLLHILNSQRRRCTIRVLASTAPLPRERMLKRVAAREHDTTPGEVTRPQYKRAYVSWRQQHREKLAAADVVTVHDEQGGPYIERGPGFDAYVTALDRIHEVANGGDHDV